MSTLAQLKAIKELQLETADVIEHQHQLLLEKRKDDDTSAHQREERTSDIKSRPRQHVMEDVGKIPEQRHQLLLEEVRNVVPGMVNVVRGGTNVRELLDLREEQEID